MFQRILATVTAIVLATVLRGEEPKELQTAREHYQQASPQPQEADRERYVMSLAHLRDRLAHDRRTEDWQAVDAEIRRHPVPKDADAKALAKIRLGKWRSPRHEYLFRADGTWTMLPEVIDGVKNTHGTWRIEGNKYFEDAAVPSTTGYTIILLNRKDFIFADGQTVFYEVRITK